MAINLTPREKNQVKDFENTYMIGRLVKKGDFLWEGNGFESVQINHEEREISFYIKPLCDEVKIINDKINNYLKFKDVFIGQDFYGENTAQLKIIKIPDINSRKIKIESVLEGNLILFKPKYKISAQSSNDCRVYKKLEIVKILTNQLNIDVNFSRLIEVNYESKDFENKLLSGEFIRLENALEETPEFIFCGDYIYNFGHTKWENSDNSNYKLKKEGKIEKLPVNHYIEKLIKADKNLWFVEEGELYNLFENKKSQVKIIALDEKDPEINKPTVTKQVEKIDEKDDVEMQESEFIDALKEYTLGEKLYYSKEDLTNFHICVKTNFLTILAGMSGTGKSKLARVYSEMLDRSTMNENLLFVPISPSYTEPSDIIGFLNINTGIYQPSETGLLDILINAEKNSDKMYIIIFDEMNLSQVEHWFAPFMSLLEEEENNRYLKLYSESANCLNKFLYPSSIKISSNIRFIGTMNIDETTRDISDRLLDRSNIITLKKTSFLACKKDLLSESISKERLISSKKKCRDFFTYKSWIVKDENKYSIFKDSELEFYDKLHCLIEEIDPQKGVSFRVLEKIGEYLLNIPRKGEEKLLSYQEAIDLQIKQRVISKLKGSSDILGELIGEYDRDNKSIIESKLIDLFNSNEAKLISNFNSTKNEIIKKSKELSLYGYTN